ELRRRLHDSSLTIVDVLPEASYVEAHIPGALNLPLENLPGRARELLPDLAADIAVYCGQFTCPRAQQAVALLHELGYANVRDYRGGIADWVESGEPTESVTDTAPPEPDPRATTHDGPPLAASQSGVVGRGPARVSRMRLLDNSMLDLVQQRSTWQLFLIWMG